MCVSVGEELKCRADRSRKIAGYIPTIAEALSSPPRQDIRLLSPPWFKFIPAAPTAPVLITWNGDLVASPPAETFYNLLPVAEAERWAAQLAPSSFEAINTTADYVPYDGKVRTLYVRCLHDNTVTEEIVDGYLGQPGARFEVSVLDADHVPMLSRPEMVVGVIREFAEGGVL
jgi:pimeloyl-ACP methyl ester carboxylesterase